MRKGHSQRAALIMLSSIQDSTMRQYEKPLRLWWEYTKRENISPFTDKAECVTKFLTELECVDKSYSTLNIYRSAISLMSLNDFGKNSSLSRFFKGLAAQKPPQPKYNTTWDPEIVISELAKQYPNENLSLEKLTKKLVTLMALITAHRAQTFAKIETDQITWETDSVQTKVPQRIKTSGHNKCQPLLHIPLFKEPHSTRHAATSVAARKGLNLEFIRKTAGWTEKSTVLAKFYNKPVQKSQDFEKTVLNENH
ncbi:hypothetical protein TKK_0002875 [Trichogramma kaykai]